MIFFVRSVLPLKNSSGVCGRLTPARWTMKSADFILLSSSDGELLSVYLSMWMFSMLRKNS